MRTHWRDPEYWRWWWRQRAPFALKLLLAVAVCSTVVVLSVAAANRGDVPSPAATSAVETPTAIFAEEFDERLRGESILYSRWKQLNPVEAAAYESYADDVKIGLRGRPPVAVTPLGRALVAAASIASDSASAVRQQATPASGR